MSSNHSSKLLLVLSAVALVIGALGVAGAIGGDVPETAKVGTETNATITLNQSDLYDRYDQWTLRGETELENATWTVVGYNAADREVSRVTYPQDGGSGETFEHAVDIEDDVVRLEIRIRGTVPSADRINFTYSPPQSLTVAELTQVKGTNRRTLATFTTRPYSEESRRARRAIERAEEAVNGSSSQNAKKTLTRAKEFYDAHEFQSAISAANDARKTAKQAKQQSQLMQTAIYVVLGLLVLGAIVGAVWWYRKNQRASRL